MKKVWIAGMAIAICLQISGCTAVAFMRAATSDERFNNRDATTSTVQADEGGVLHSGRNDQSMYPSIVYDRDLGSGHYTVGIDIPAGKYDLTAVSGGGNVYSSNAYNGGINAIMGVTEKNANGINIYQQTYANIMLPRGAVLSISGVTINLYCDEASGEPLDQREQVGVVEIELSNGYFTAGDDFKSGTYDIIAVAGGGNVSSSNIYDGGINAVIGVEELNANGIDIYEQIYRNIHLPNGTILDVDGVTIRLVPSN